MGVAISVRLVTIKKDRDFKKAYSRGKSYVSSCVVLYVNRNFKKGTRIGITASKKIGNAVRRNRARRVIRQAYLSLVNNKSFGNLDFVFVARARTPDVKSYDVKKCIASLFNSMRLG